MYSSVRGREGIVSNRSYFGYSILLTRFYSTTRVEDYGDRRDVLISGTGRARRRGGCLFTKDVSDGSRDVPDTTGNSRLPYSDVFERCVRNTTPQSFIHVHVMVPNRRETTTPRPNTRYCRAAFHRFPCRLVLVFNTVTLFDGNRTKNRLVTSGDVFKIIFFQKYRRF